MTKKKIHQHALVLGKLHRLKQFFRPFSQCGSLTQMN